MSKLNQITNISTIENLNEVKGGTALAWNIQKAYAGLSCCGPYAVQYSNTGSAAGGTTTATWANLWGTASWSFSWGTAATTNCNTSSWTPRPC